MLLMTVDTLPEGFETTEIFGMVWVRMSVKISASLFGNKGETEDDMLRELEKMGRRHIASNGQPANAILGVKVAMTSIIVSGNTYAVYYASGTAVYMQATEK